MQAKEILEKAADLLEKMDWTTAHMARNSIGSPVQIKSPHACKFCMTGAILKVADETPLRPFMYPYNSVATITALHTLLEVARPGQSGSIAEWKHNLTFHVGRLTYVNDHIVKNKQEATELLRKAATQA